MMLTLKYPQFFVLASAFISYYSMIAEAFSSQHQSILHQKIDKRVITPTLTSRVSHSQTHINFTKLSAGTSADENDPLADLSDERRANLFESLLRDLQIEDVPLLGCDADAVHSMNAALWTTLAEVSEIDDGQKLCIVMENIPLSALKAFVEDFTMLKTQTRLMDHLPELARLNISLLGKGVGPALILESRDRTDEEKRWKESMLAVESSLSEIRCTAALKSFIDRIVVGEEACPYTKSVDWAATGLEARGITPGPVAYRYSSSYDTCAALSSFWNCACEMLNTKQEDLSTTMLSLPAIGYGDSEEAHARFSAVVELISRNLCFFRGDAVFGLVHFHPAYDRESIHPVNKPAYGHLPPQSWLRPMLKMNGNVEAAENLTDEQLRLSNYQRRSPFTAINILRVNQLSAATGAKSIVQLDLGNGVIERASGITTYSRNAIRMAKVGVNALEDGMKSDKMIFKGS